MAFMLNDSSLPWSNFRDEFEDYEFKDFLKERLKTKYILKLLHIFSAKLRPVMTKVHQMKFEDEPPYAEIIDALNAEIQSKITFGPDL